MTISTQVTLKQLRYFSRIVELGGISRASHDLHIAQTALGLQVRALEDSLGVSLLLRHPKGVTATEEGKYVYDRSKEITASVDELVSDIRSRASDRPRDIWLGLAPNVMRAIGVQAAVLQADQIPGIRLHLLEASRNELLDEVRRGELDWAIVHEAEKVDGMITIPILREAILLVTRRGDGLIPGPVHLRDALSRDLVLDSGRRVVARVLSKAAQELGLKANIRFEIDSVAVIKQMILLENLSGFFNFALVKEEVERGELEIHEIVNPPLEITAYFVVRSHDSPKGADLPVLGFIDTLLDSYCEDIPIGETRLNRLVAFAECEPALLPAGA